MTSQDEPGRGQETPEEREPRHRDRSPYLCPLPLTPACRSVPPALWPNRREESRGKSELHADIEEAGVFVVVGAQLLPGRHLGPDGKATLAIDPVQPEQQAVFRGDRA